MGAFRMIGIIMMFVLFGLIVFIWITYFDLKEEGPKITKCYDRYSNEIIGEECIDEGDDLLFAAFLTTFLSMIGIVGMSTLGNVDDILDS